MSIPVISKSNKGRGATKKKIQCPDCGHEWFPTGKGKFAVCPKCYEEDHGHPPGEHFKKTKGLTLTVREEKPSLPKTDPIDPPPGPPVTHPEPVPPVKPQTPPVDLGPPSQDPGPEPEKTGFKHKLRAILEKPII